MNQLQFRGKLHDETFLISILGIETTLRVAHVLFPRPTNVFKDTPSDNQSTILAKFNDFPLFCPFYKEYKAPFDKTLVLREFNKNGNLEDILFNNDEIEELYLAFILKGVLFALSKVHSLGFCNLGIEPKFIEINDDGDLLFPFYYNVQKISAQGLVKDLIDFKKLVKQLIRRPDLEFKDIDKSKFSNRFKDFLKCLLENYGFEDILTVQDSLNELYVKR
jgi:serine/threonine protein kinase